MTRTASDAPAAALQRSGETLTVSVSGAWRLDDPTRPLWRQPGDGDGARRVVLADRGISRWDSSLALFALSVRDWCSSSGAAFDIEGLPKGVRELVAQAAIPALPPPPPKHVNPVAHLGLEVEALAVKERAAAEFVGECALGLLRFALRPGRLRWKDWLLHVQQAGAEGLPIISLVSFLVGTIIAFQAALQLKRFGAEVYVVDFVDLSMAREMGAVMVAIVLSGRTAAAYAAELGSMAAGEELDALETAGLSPVDLLVVPRLLAMAFVTPMLTLYADVLGILGGSAVALGMLKIPLLTYYLATRHALRLSDLRMGLIKSFAFGIIIAICGCLKGFTGGRDTAGVGRAATSAVVSSILWIIVADAVFGQFFSAAVRR
jgi:phospholipid/cholesterol/gamma-HCH transport system permease protein